MDVDIDVLKPRKRDPNFTADEKVLLAHLIQQFPIIEAKLVDGKSILRKKQAWKNITQQFNSQVNVHKRDTVTLKRAWDNLKAATRKARASKGNLKTGSVPISPLPSEREAIISIVEEVMISRVKENNDNDSDKLKDIPSPCHMVSVQLEDQESEDSFQVDPKDNLTMVSVKLEHQEDDDSRQADPAENISNGSILSNDRLTDYVRQEAEMRFKLLEHKNEIEMQILNKQLEVENIRKESEKIKREAAKYLLQFNKLRYEKEKLVLEKLKNCESYKNRDSCSDSDSNK